MKKEWDISNDRPHLTGDALRVPEGYFDTLRGAVDSRIQEEIEPDQSFFDGQARQLMALAKITAVDTQQDSGFRVPEGYFTQAQERILNERTVQQLPTKKVFWIRPMFWSSAAASVAVLLTWYWLQRPSASSANFEHLLAEVDLNENDLEWIADAEDLAMYYLDLEAAPDSLLPDSLEKNIAVTDTLPPEPKQPKTPNIPPKQVNWDALTDEDIMEYLLESGDADEWIE